MVSKWYLIGQLPSFARLSYCNAVHYRGAVGSDGGGMAGQMVVWASVCRGSRCIVVACSLNEGYLVSHLCVHSYVLS